MQVVIFSTTLFKICGHEATKLLMPYYITVLKIINIKEKPGKEKKKNVNKKER